MYCPNCGTQIENGSAFCFSCGSPLSPSGGNYDNPREPKKKNRWMVLMVVLIVLIVLVILGIGIFLITHNQSQAESKKYEGNGFESPKEAAVAYLNALKEADVDKMLSTFALESYVENYDLQKYIEWQTCLSPVGEQLMPPTSELSRDVNLHRRMYRITNDIYYQYLNITQPDSPILEGLTYPMEGKEIKEYVQECGDVNHINKLKDMKIGSYMDMEEYLEKTDSFDKLENIQKLVDKKEDVYGAEEIYEGCVVVEINGEGYVLFMEAGKFDGKWYNLNFSGVIGSIAAVMSNEGGLSKDSYEEIKRWENMDNDTEEAKENADMDLLDSVYKACSVTYGDPEITQRPTKGQNIDKSMFQDTDWGRETLSILGVSSISDVEKKLKSQKTAGESIEIYLDENGYFAVSAGSITVP